ncbi:hypothetical protein GQ54DRAFT_296772 [Martensiomyces pterosporus]|nr:hypothetical protein GQ54DRAFT_296772 [Martensiomyces pterosporus]
MSSQERAHHAPEDACQSVIRRAIALESEDRDKYWRTNADVWQMEDMLQHFSQTSDAAINRTLATGGDNIALMPELTTALPPAHMPGGDELVCDPAFSVNASTDEPASAATAVRECATVGGEPQGMANDSSAVVSHAVPVGVDDLQLELDMSFVPLAQLGATTLQHVRQV